MAKLKYKQDETTYKIWDKVEERYVTRNLRPVENRNGNLLHGVTSSL